MKTSTKRLLILAVCGAGLGFVNAVAAQQEAAAATGQPSFAPLSLEQQQAQQVINNKIVRIPPVGFGLTALKMPPAANRCGAGGAAQGLGAHAATGGPARLHRCVVHAQRSPRPGTG